MGGKFLSFEYLMPKTIRETCSLLSKYKDQATVVAGGTDLMVLMKSKQVTPQYIINLKAIPDLNYIHYTDEEGLKIGALATMHDLESSALIQARFPILSNAACQVGSPTLRNMATIGGNLSRGAPSADIAPALIGLGAKIKIVGLNGDRTCGIEGFFLGPGTCVLCNDEILTEIQIPTPPPYTRGVYLKLPAGKRVSIAVVGVAVVVTLDPQQTKTVDAKIVLSAVAPTPIRATKAEDLIKGKLVKEDVIEKAAQIAAEEARPISDIRASANYRKEMVRVLTAQALRQVTAST